jgi:cytochrome P450
MAVAKVLKEKKIVVPSPDELVTPPYLAPPRAPVSSLDIVQNFSNGNTPWFFEEIAERIGSDIYQLSSNIYIVGETKTAREILCDKLSQKSPSTTVWSQLFGSHTMNSYQSTTGVWHKTRKAVNRSFSSGETNRMRCIAVRIVKDWINETLEPAIANNQSIDPSKEMNRITFKILLEAALEYVPTDKEYESIAHHIGVGMREIAVKNIRNPMRKYYGPFLSEYREAMKSRAHLQAFGRRILETYRKNPNKSSNNTIIKMIESTGAYVGEADKIAEISHMVVGELMDF